MACLKDSLHASFCIAAMNTLATEQPSAPMMIVLTPDDNLVTVVFPDYSPAEIVSPEMVELYPGQAIMAHFLIDGVAFSVSRFGLEPEVRRTVLIPIHNASQTPKPPQEILDFFSKE